MSQLVTYRLKYSSSFRTEYSYLAVAAAHLVVHPLRGGAY